MYIPKANATKVEEIAIQIFTELWKHPGVKTVYPQLGVEIDHGKIYAVIKSEVKKSLSKL